MAEFFKNSLNAGSASITFARCVKSFKTVWRASVLDAEVNRDPAYLPAAVSAMLGGLWPE